MDSPLGVGRMFPLRWQAAAKSPSGGGSGRTLGPNLVDFVMSQEVSFSRTATSHGSSSSSRSRSLLLQ